MRGILLTAVSLLSLSQLTYANPMVVPEILLTNCLPDRVYMAADYNSLNRQVELGQKITPLSHEMVGMMDSYKGEKFAHRPVEDFLSAEDLQRLKELLSQIAHYKMKSLAESQLQRDMGIIFDLVKIAKDDRDNKLDPRITASIMRANKANTATSKYTPPDYDDAKKLLYLQMLRNNIGSAQHTDEKDKSVCSLGLALETENARDVDAFEQTLKTNPGVKWIQELRVKYHMTDNNFSAVQMSTVEKNRLQKIQTELGPLTTRQSMYWQDLNNLRFLVDLVCLEYQHTVDYVDEHKTFDVAEMTRHEDQLFKEAGKEMKFVRQLWYRIGNDFPDRDTKSNQFAADELKKYQ